MKHEVTVPVIFEAVPQRSREAKTVIGACRAEIRIREISGQDAPVGVFRPANPESGRGLAYRVFEGGFWEAYWFGGAGRQYMEQDTVDAVRGPAWMGVSKRIAGIPASFIAFPKAKDFFAIREGGFSLSKLPAASEHFRAVEGAFGQNEAYMAACDVARAQAQANADRMVYVDGVRYRKAREPCLALQPNVKKNNASLLQDSLETHAATLAGWRTGTAFSGPGRDTVHFTLDCGDDARALARELGLILTVDRDEPNYVTIFRDDLPYSDMEAMELDRNARLLSIDVADGIARISRSKALVRQEDARELFLSLFALNDLLGAADPFAGQTDDLEPATMRLLSSVRDQEARGLNVLKRVDLEVVGRCLRRFQQRPISVNASGPVGDYRP